MKSLWQKVVNIGIDEAVDPSEIKYITLTNLLAAMAFLCQFVFLPVLLAHYPESGIFVFFWSVGTPLCLIVIMLNHVRLHQAARVFFNVLAMTAYTSVSLAGGRDMAYHYHLVLVVITAFFSYPPGQKRIMYAIVLSAFVLFVGLEAWFLNHRGFFDLSPGFLKGASFTMDMALIVYFVSFTFYVYTVYLRTEEKAETLLHNVLPAKIANRLKIKEQTIAEGFESCTVLFADIVGFTIFSEKTSPQDLVDLLNRIFSEFDLLAEKYGLEKIKTAGDSYMIVAGVPEQRGDHAEAIADFALEMRATIEVIAAHTGSDLRLRIGIHSGPVVAGVIGKKKFVYDLWGDTVNTASRMESHGIPGEIQVSKDTSNLLRDRYLLVERGGIEVKGKGLMHTCLLKGRKQRTE